MADAEGPRRQSLLFLLLYALAWAGGAIAYVPFLTIWLPGRMTELAGAADVQTLGYVTFFGAIAASVGGIGFGWLSDRTRNRRGWILAGLVMTIALLLVVPLAQDIWSLVAMIVAWQLTLNMMLGPLAAWAGDLVPDEQKGLLGGLLAFSPALGGWSGWLVTWPGLVTAEQRLVVRRFVLQIAVADRSDVADLVREVRSERIDARQDHLGVNTRKHGGVQGHGRNLVPGDPVFHCD